MERRRGGEDGEEKEGNGVEEERKWQLRKVRQADNSQTPEQVHAQEMVLMFR